MQSLLTIDSDLCQPSKPPSLLPEFEVCNGIRIQKHRQYGLWMVGTRGDLVLFRVKYIMEGKVEKEKYVQQFIITHDQVASGKNWEKYVWDHFRHVDWNEFMPAYQCALELLGYEMSDEIRFIKL